MSVKGFVEYIAEMGNEEAHKLESFVENLLTNYLKVKYVGGRDLPHWQTEINAWEASLFRVISRTPSLRSHEIDLSKIYTALVGRAAYRGELRKQYPRVQFPAACPFTLKQIVGNRVWKEIGPKAKAQPKKR